MYHTISNLQSAQMVFFICNCCTYNFLIFVFSCIVTIYKLQIPTKLDVLLSLVGKKNQHFYLWYMSVLRMLKQIVSPISIIWKSMIFKADNLKWAKVQFSSQFLQTLQVFGVNHLRIVELSWECLSTMLQVKNKL